MHNMDITHVSASDEYVAGNRPEAFTVRHNGDFSGEVKIEMMSPRVRVYSVADGGTIFGNPVAEVTIPFEVLKQVVAEYARRERISRIENASDTDVLLGGAS